MGIDPTSFLHDEILRAKKELERALARGDTAVAARQATRVAELLRELAKYKRVGGSDLISLASEYEDLARRLKAGEPIRPASLEAVKQERLGRVQGREELAGSAETGEVGKMDMEFEAVAESLIAKASVTWDDIAGLEEVKRALMEAIFFSLATPSVAVRFEPPRRFLLYGPPGTGKTMLAMAASNMLKATFFNVSVDRVLSRYVGDSPRIISAIFRVAYRKAPSIIFFDEIEILTAKRDTGRDVATGVIQTFLTELDGFKTKQLDKPVIVMAATNKPWMLDEAIISRFEKRIYIPLPDREARKELFRLEIEKKGFKVEGITYEELAEITEGYSGRDISNACKEAIMAMLREANPDIYEQISRAQTLEEIRQAKYKVKPITREQLIHAIKKIKPATTHQDIQTYLEWAKKYGAS